MAHAAVNTKVDIATEAVEDLAVAVHARLTSPTAYTFEAVIDARQKLKEALTELVQPTLRVVGGTDKS